MSIESRLEALETITGGITETQNTKVDLDIENLNSSAKLKVLGWIMPDYTNAVSISTNYSVTNYGYIYAERSGAAQNTSYVYVNGFRVYATFYDGDGAQESNCFIPVMPGDTITFTGAVAVKFMPMKGAE